MEQQGNYIVIPTNGGGFMAYVSDSATPCSAYGETQEEALINLSYCLEEYADEIYDISNYD